MVLELRLWPLLALRRSARYSTPAPLSPRDAAGLVGEVTRFGLAARVRRAVGRLAEGLRDLVTAPMELPVEAPVTATGSDTVPSEGQRVSWTAMDGQWSAWLVLPSPQEARDDAEIRLYVDNAPPCRWALLAGVAVAVWGLWRWRLGQIIHLVPATTRILCATRGGQASQPTHERAIQLAKERDAELLFLYVFDQRVLQRIATPIVINEEAQIEHMLEFLRTTAQEQARLAGVGARVVVRAGRLREELVEVSREEHVSLIVLGSPAGSASRFQVAAMSDLMSEIEEATGVEVMALGSDNDVLPDQVDEMLGEVLE